MNTSVEVAVLGPLEIHVDGVAVAVGERMRALVAVLALQPSREVAATRLIEAIWPDGAPGAAPDSGRNALQALVSRTRRALGVRGAHVLVTSPRGYVLDLPHAAFDAGRLEAAVAAARTVDPVEVDVQGLGAALAAWRGDPLVEIADDPDAVAATSRLHELRLEGIELHAEAVLARGGGAELVAELRGPAASHPTRERLHRALALALYRAGRQTDALAVLDTLTSLLRDELGLDPDPRTDALRTAVLRHELDVGGAGSVPVGAGSAPVVAGSVPVGAGSVPVGAGSVPVGAAGRGATTDPGAAAGGGTRPLPRPRTSFVGRAEELEELSRLVTGGARLVTLVGPGGTGKTRLAVEVAATLDPAPDDGVAFVDLAPLTDASDVLPEVAAAVGLGAPEGGSGPAGRTLTGRPLRDRVRDHLRDADLVIVVDNCEHVIEAAAATVEFVLDVTSDVKVLATSREGLRVDGEHLWSVPPLRVAHDEPAAGGAVGGGAPGGGLGGAPEVFDPEALLRFDATRLFVQRARAADPSFVLDASTAPAVSELCRRLDGLPLGIELAAARVATLPVTALAERLGDRFRLLTGGRRSVRRQETLAAVVGWSYDLLDERQRQVFRRLGVFSGEVGVDLVEAVLSAPDLPRSAVLPTLAELADRSLVLLTEPNGGGPRVRMLETMRAYAQERLASDDDAAAVRARHATVFAEHAEHAEPALRGADQLVWFRRLDDEIDELRVAATWWLTADPARAVRMSSDLAWYSWLRDRSVEGARWLERSLAAAGDTVAPEDAAMAWSWSSLLHSFIREQAEAEVAAAHARDALRRAGDAAPGFARAGVVLIDAFVRAFGSADLGAVLADLEAGLASATQLDEPWLIAVGHYLLGSTLTAAGQRDLARSEFLRGVAAAELCGDRWVAFQIRSQLAHESTVDGDYAAAADHLDHAIPLAVAIGAHGHAMSARAQRAAADLLAGDLTAAGQRLDAVLAGTGGRGVAASYARSMLAVRHRRAGDLDAAIEVGRQAEASYLDLGETDGAFVACVELAHARLAQDEVDAARSTLERAVGLARSHLPAVSLRPAIPYLQEADAAVVLAEGGPDAARSAGLRLGRAARLREDLGRPLVGGERFDVDRIETAIAERIGVDALRATLAEGRERTGLLPPLD